MRVSLLMTLVRHWPALAATGLAAVLYLHAFDRAPMYIGGDEAHFGVQAKSIAATGRDLNGRFLPLFVNLQGPLGEHQTSSRWYQPLLFYAIALTLRVFPLTEWSIRIPSVTMAIVNVLLVYAVAYRLFRHRWYALLAALLLLLTPAHLIFSRQAADYVLPVPFVLGWLLCLTFSLETGSARASVAGGVLLGVGLFSYIAAWAWMPFFLVLGWIAQYRSGKRFVLPALAAGVAFAVPLVLLVSWLWAHPDMLATTFARYSTPGTRHLTLLQRVRDFLNYNNVQELISIYWDYFNPAFLFFAGGSNLTTATRNIGVFSLPFSVLLVCGLFDAGRRALREPVPMVLVAGLFFAPVPATLLYERYAIQRELVLLPLAVLIGTYGLVWLMRHPRRAASVVAVVVLVAAPIQFSFFYRDYFTGYRIRSAHWFDPIDFRDVAEYVIASDGARHVPAVYFGEDLDDVGARWRFYLIKTGREDLLSRTRFFRAEIFEPERVLPGSLLVLYVTDPSVPDLIGAGGWSVATTVNDAATGAQTAIVLRKNG